MINTALYFTEQNLQERKFYPTCRFNF